MGRRLLIIDVAALGYSLLEKRDELCGLKFRPIETVFPAVTCTVQGSFRTAMQPDEHGMIANGRLFRDLRRVMFWEQSSNLVRGPRIWESFRTAGNRVGMMFWQQSLGEQVDLVLSPAPIHKHGGGMITNCFCRPEPLYADLVSRIGRAFPLHRYWGPMASAKVGDWIAEAVALVLSDSDLAPELLLTYLPSLDYDLQRHGPSSARAQKALDRTMSQLEGMIGAAGRNDYEVLIFGDYAIGPVSGPAIMPNLELRKAGLMSVRSVGRMEYPDLHNSRAFAVADHEIAHVYVKDSGDIEQVRRTLDHIEGISEVRGAMDHPDSGELVAVASEGRWIAYPWWTDKKRAPDYARHVDIHNKPGYDPCELFFGTLPVTTSLDSTRIAGSHGRTGPGREAAWTSTLQPIEAGSIVELAGRVRQWLEGAEF
jgi:predicted AlkP superfamily pyrophosphatase or phosphodiesterase